MINWYVVVMKNYVGFSGRARLAEYWYFLLVNVIVAFLLGVVDGLTGIGILSPLYSLVVLLPGIAVAIRRLHDIDYSGWYVLLGLVPVVGGLILLFLFTRPGTAGANRFGADPLSEPMAENVE